MAYMSSTPTEAPSSCFHCGLPVPRGPGFSAVIDGARRPMCCKGCEAVAQAIVNGGLADYYRYRDVQGRTSAAGGRMPEAATARAYTIRERVPAFLQQAAVYDHPAVQKSFVRSAGEHVREAALILEGITCAACINF